MPQDIKNVDIKAFDRAVEDFYKEFEEELNEKTPEDIFADQVYKEALEEEKDWDPSRIQSVEEQNRILHEYEKTHPFTKEDNEFIEYSDEVNEAWKNHDWAKLTKLYELEPTKETFDQFEKISKEYDKKSYYNLN